jgi:thiopurine S-methyltransferase
MQADFWHQRWQDGLIGFHLNETNPNLSDWFDRLRLENGMRVFVPLCGKSLDLIWLREQGLDVVGVEISELAVRSFFEENDLTPEIRNIGNHDYWQADGITIIHGDFFDIQKADIGEFNAVYDRASLIALPTQMRQAYAEKMHSLVPDVAFTLLITLEYSQEKMAGPPFSVSLDEIEALYGSWYAVEKLSAIDLLVSEPGFREKGLDELTENVYLLGR